MHPLWQKMSGTKFSYNVREYLHHILCPFLRCFLSIIKYCHYCKKCQCYWELRMCSSEFWYHIVSLPSGGGSRFLKSWQLLYLPKYEMTSLDKLQALWKYMYKHVLTWCWIIWWLPQFSYDEFGKQFNLIFRQVWYVVS